MVNTTTYLILVHFIIFEMYAFRFKCMHLDLVKLNLQKYIFSDF